MDDTTSTTGNDMSNNSTINPVPGRSRVTAPPGLLDAQKKQKSSQGPSEALNMKDKNMAPPSSSTTS